MHHHVPVSGPAVLSQQPSNEDCRPFWQCSISRVPQAPDTNQSCFGGGGLCGKLSCRQMRSAELHHCQRLCQSLETHFAYVRDMYLPDKHTLMADSHFTTSCLSIAGGCLQQTLKASTMHQYSAATQMFVSALAHTATSMRPS